jgi:hypothetical protein
MLTPPKSSLTIIIFDDNPITLKSTSIFILVNDIPPLLFILRK